jgi:hypothetical protein
MCAFGGKSKNKDVVSICNLLELISFIGIIAINKKEDGGVVHFMCSGKWDKGLLKPIKANFIVSPPIG